MPLYFTNGNHVEIISQNFKHDFFKDPILVKEVNTFGKHNTLYEYVVERANLHEICSDKFSVGEDVKRIDNNYVGTVTGFELDKNLVVTRPKMPAAMHNGHMRYAIDSHLLERHSDYEVMFRAGQFYKLGEGRTYLVVADDDGRYCDLVNYKGVAVFRHVPMQTTMVDLQLRFGITEFNTSKLEEWTV